MTDSSPRVLFCTSEIPQSVNAGSMQLFRALQGYPGDRLMVLGAAPEPDAELLPCRYETLRLLTYRLACTRFRSWTSGLNAMNTLVEPQLSRSVEMVRDFSPELVVTVMDKLSFYKHAWALSRRLAVPLLVITMDDPQTFERAHPWLEGSFVRFLRQLYRDAALSLGVSQEMCEYLEARFGKKSTAFYSGPPEGIVSRPPETSRELRNAPRLRLAYAGSLGLGYREGLLAILDALEGADAEVHLFTRDQHCLIDHPRIINRGFLPPARLWPVVQTDCDALLLPYAFEGPMLRVYRTHFPTKLAEYCQVGMPIVVAGPEDATGLRWAVRHPEVAAAANSPRPEVLGESLRRLRDDGGRRVAMALAGAEFARREFDPVRIRKQFWDHLRSAADAPLGKDPARDRRTRGQEPGLASDQRVKLPTPRRSWSSYAKVQSWLGGLLRNRRFQLRKKRVRELRYLDLGCGRNTHEALVNMDFLWHPQVDLCWDVRLGLPFADGSLSGIFTEHCLEHFDLPVVEQILTECRRVLGPGRILRIVVPDAELYLRTYQRHSDGDVIASFPFQGMEGLGGEFAAMLSVNRVFYQDRDSPSGHRTMFDFRLLDLLLRRAGFAAADRVRFREGRDPVLLVDSASRMVESLYVDAATPGVAPG